MEEWKTSMLGACFMLGFAATLLWLPMFADKYGRKKYFRFSLMMDLILYTWMIMTRSYHSMLVILTILGGLNSLRSQVGFIYLIELNPRKWQSTICCIWGVLEVFVYIFITVYYEKISKESMPTMVAGYIFCLTGVILTSWLPESPRFLVNSGQLVQAKEVFETIADWNKKKL